MLQLVIGIAGTGKTTHLLAQISCRAAAGKKSIYLVPEQFSSSAEAMLYKALGDERNNLVEVLSFRTLAERVLKLCGGINVRMMTDAGRAVFVRRALDSVGSELQIFARQKRSAAFCNTCAETIHELKTAGATPETLRAVAAHRQDEKLAEIALVFATYEASLQGAAMDPGDRLTLAAAHADCGYFADKACFIDNFDGFTAPEYTMLKQIVLQCNAVFAAFCCDTLVESDDDMGRFSPVRHAANRLMQLARQASCVVEPLIVLVNLWRQAAPGLKAVNLLLAGELPQEEPVLSDGVFLSKAYDEWEEVRLVATKMHSLSQRGVPYSQMALVCREISHYESAVRRHFSLLEIPYFVDAPATVEYTAPVVFLRAALALLRTGLVSQPILALLKTGLCGYTEREIFELENYVYTWEPKAEDWRKPFEKNPSGLLAREDDKSEEKLAVAEYVRGEVVPVLEAFLRRARKGSSAEVSKQLYLLLNQFQAGEHCEEAARRLEEAGEITYAEVARRAWDVTMGFLEQMALLLGEEVLAPDEYDELFLLLVRSTDFGQVPQSLECVIFTSADRMRLADPAYCFVVGLSEGEFPMQVGYSGLLTHADREALVECGVEMPGSFANRVLLEEMFFYRALTGAKEGLYLSWPQRRRGVARAMSAALEPLLVSLAPPPLQQGLEEEAATPKAAFDLLGRLYRQDRPEAASLYAALLQSSDDWAIKALRLLEEVENDGEFAIHDVGALQRIVGEDLTFSATQAERYYACRFAYYMERILSVRPRRKAELSPLESGTFVHAILEKVLQEAGDGFAQYTNVQLSEAATQHADAFIAENLPDETRRAQYLLGQIKRSTNELLYFLRDAAAQSDFSIDALELPVGDTSGVPALEITTADGRTVKVTGKVDRVDVLRKNGNTYLCILDYKTGDKKFNLADVYCGINMQMLVYMDALCKKGKNKYKNPVPAGVLYLTGDPRPESGSRKDVEKPVYKMDGLLLEDASLLHAMDHDGSGIFLPVKYNKDGTPRAGRQLASLEKIGKISQRVEELFAQMAQGVGEGIFPAKPQVKNDSRPCDYCPYHAACRHENGRNEVPVKAPEKVFEADVGPAEEGGTLDG